MLKAVVKLSRALVGARFVFLLFVCGWVCVWESKKGKGRKDLTELVIVTGFRREACTLFVTAWAWTCRFVIFFCVVFV